MTVTAKGHWNGDATRHCGRLAVEADTQGEAAQLALLFRVLADPERRAHLVEAAGAIEACLGAAPDPVPA